MNGGLTWWQKAVVYQLLVPSFQDSDDDGCGDLAGVIARLDYLEWLRVDAVWLSPIFRSPLRELGYDVSDYLDVEPRFGTLDVFDELVAGAHERGIRVILDWVPNHTSDLHPWFRDSVSGRESSRRAWYIWRDPKPDGSPPNNWISVFGGSVWQWDERSGQYYMHTFLPQQPDLNWRNPEVRAAMLDTLRFWLDRGVDGFRVDATDLLLKDEQFRDNPPNPEFGPNDGPDSRLLPVHTRDQPGLHDVLAEIRAVVDERGGDRVLLGELYVPLETLVTYYGSPQRPELHLPLNLWLAWTAWEAEALSRRMERYQSLVPGQGWPTAMLGTHDALRIAMRTRTAQRRVAAMLLMTQRGTVSHYYGDEVGMQGVDIPAQRAIDPQGRRTGRNRDPERTPMQWSGERNGGFTSGRPWLPVGHDVAQANVAAERDDPRSLLSLYRRLIELRRERQILVDGAFVPVACDRSLLVYRRTDSRSSLLVALNLGEEPRRHEMGATQGRLLLSTSMERQGEACSGAIELRGDEGAIVEVPNAGGARAGDAAVRRRQGFDS